MSSRTTIWTWELISRSTLMLLPLLVYKLGSPHLVQKAHLDLLLKTMLMTQASRLDCRVLVDIKNTCVRVAHKLRLKHPAIKCPLNHRCENRSCTSPSKAAMASNLAAWLWLYGLDWSWSRCRNLASTSEEIAVEASLIAVAGSHGAFYGLDLVSSLCLVP